MAEEAKVSASPPVQPQPAAVGQQQPTTTVNDPKGEEIIAKFLSSPEGQTLLQGYLKQSANQPLKSSDLTDNLKKEPQDPSPQGAYTLLQKEAEAQKIEAEKSQEIERLAEEWAEIKLKNSSPDSPFKTQIEKIALLPTHTLEKVNLAKLVELNDFYQTNPLDLRDDEKKLLEELNQKKELAKDTAVINSMVDKIKLIQETKEKHGLTKAIEAVNSNYLQKLDSGWGKWQNDFFGQYFDPKKIQMQQQGAKV